MKSSATGLASALLLTALLSSTAWGGNGGGLKGGFGNAGFGPGGFGNAGFNKNSGAKAVPTFKLPAFRPHYPKHYWPPYVHYSHRYVPRYAPAPRILVVPQQANQQQQIVQVGAPAAPAAAQAGQAAQVQVVQPQRITVPVDAQVQILVNGLNSAPRKVMLRTGSAMRKLDVMHWEEGAVTIEIPALNLTRNNEARIYVFDGQNRQAAAVDVTLVEQSLAAAQ